MHDIRTSPFGYRRPEPAPFRFLLADGDEKPPAETKTFTQAEVDEQIKGLKTKNDELLGKLQKSKIKDLPDDATPEEIADAVRERREKKTKDLEAKGQYEELTRQNGEKHVKEKKELEDKLSAKEKKIVTREKTIAAKDAIRELEGKEKWLMPEILPQLAVEEDGDDYNVFVVDKRGNAVMNTDGTKKTAKQLVAELRENDEWKDAFLAPDVSGGGARGGTGRQQSNGDVVLTGADAKDPVKYRAAKVQAEKNGGQVVLR